MIDELIIVTGTLRSGISIVGGVINLCGAWGGEFTDTMRFDGKSSYENPGIRHSLVKPLLRGMRVDPLGQRPLPDIKRCKEVAKKVEQVWMRSVERIILLQGYKEGPIFIASAQAALIWPIWAKVFPKAKWVLVRRKDEDVIRSCMRTAFMRGYDTEEGWQKWIDEHKLRFEEMTRAGLSISEVWPQEVINGKLEGLKSLIVELGLKWDQPAAEVFVAPILWKAGVFEMNE